MKPDVPSLIATVCLAAGLSVQAQDKMVPLQQVSAAGDGTIAGVGPNGEVFAFSAGAWIRLQGVLKQISTGSSKQFWGVNASNQVFQLSSNGWQQVPGTLKEVAVDKSGGGKVLGLDPAGVLYSWNGSGWTQITGAPVLAHVATTGNPDRIYGADASNKIYRWKAGFNNNQWSTIKGLLTSISVGTDGSVAGFALTGTAVVRTEADIEAELAGSQSTPVWDPIDAPLQNVEIVSIQNVLLVDKLGQAGNHNHVFTGTLQITGQSLVVTGSGVNLNNSAFTFSQAGSGTYDTQSCVPITSGTTNITIPSGTTTNTTTLVSHVCYTGKFSKVNIQPCPQPTALTAPGPIGQLITTSRGGSCNTPPPIPGVLTPAGPVVCGGRTFRSVSNHSWVEFRLPQASQGQTVSIPSGAYNNYVFPACNRVWWDNLTFVCNQSTGWQHTAGNWDADALCTGSPGSSPYVAIGNR